MLESEIKKLTAAVEANTAALTGSAAPVAVAAPAKAAAPAAGAVDAFAAAAPAASPATAAPAAGVAAPAAAAPAPVVPEPAGQPAVALTKKTLTEKFIELAQDKGREVATALLAEYGVADLPSLKDKTQWPAFYAACEAKLV